MKSRCLVAKLIIRNSAAVGVQFYCSGSSDLYQQMATKEVIVSAGAIKTPQLFLLSGIGDPHKLASVGIPTVVPLSGVGENLQDHLIAPITLLINATSAFSDPRPSSSVDHIVFHKSSADQPTPDIEVSVQADLWDGSLVSKLPAKADVLTIGACARCGACVRSCTRPGPSHNHPRSVGSVSLNSSSPFDPPLISPNYLNNTADVDAMVLSERR